MRKMSCFGEKPKDCTCRVLFLDDTELTVQTKTSKRGYEILEKVYDHLNLSERDYFGLRFQDDTNQTHWLDEKKPIGSQLKTSQPFTFYFGVKFYVADPCKLKEELTRYQFVLQVKRDIVQGRLPVPFDVAAELGAWALQSELGDYSPERHPYGYVSEFRFVPNQSEDLEERIMHIHKKLHGHIPSSAEYRYLDKCKWLDMYGVDLHPVQGEGNVEYFLGLTPTGITIYKNKNKMGNYFWPRITKVSHKGRMFMVKVRDKASDEITHGFEVTAKQACKHLWKCCVEQHTFFRLTQTNDSSGKLVSLSAKSRHSSSKSSRTVLGDASNRQTANVTRRPSKRYQRRSSVPNKQFVEDRGAMTDTEAINANVLTPDPVRSRSGAKNSESLPDSPRSTKSAPTKSAPWESHADSQGGLYTSGRESPGSVRSERLKFPRRIPSGSESENGYAPRRRFVESGSESDASYRHVRRYRGEPLDPYTSSLRPHESMQSIGSESSQQAAARRRRKRSRSPGTKRPPEELAQHFRYIDPSKEGLSEEQMKDIAFTNVETRAEPFNVRYYNPHIRSRHKSPKRRSTGEIDNAVAALQNMPIDSEGPPPYTASAAPDNLYQSSNHMPSARLKNDTRSPASSYVNEYSSAPIVKTNTRSSSLPRKVTPDAIQPGSLYSSRSTPAVDQGTTDYNMNSPVNPHHREDSGLGPESELYDKSRPLPGHNPANQSGPPSYHSHHRKQPPSYQQAKSRHGQLNYVSAPGPSRPTGNTYSPPKRISNHPLKQAIPGQIQLHHHQQQQQQRWSGGHHKGQGHSRSSRAEQRMAVVQPVQPHEKVTEL